MKVKDKFNTKIDKKDEEDYLYDFPCTKESDKAKEHKPLFERTKKNLKVEHLSMANPLNTSSHLLTTQNNASPKAIYVSSKPINHMPNLQPEH